MSKLNRWKAKQKQIEKYDTFLIKNNATGTKIKCMFITLLHNTTCNKSFNPDFLSAHSGLKN